MIRQAHTYLAGAASSAALLAACVVGFVVLVWLNPFSGLSLPDLGGADTVTPLSTRAKPARPAGLAGPARLGAALRTPAATVRQRSGSPGGAQQPGAAADLPSGSGSPPAASGGGGAGSTRGADSPGSGGTAGGATQGSGSAAATVNGAANGADQASGGALQGTGVSAVAHGVVETALGPGSAAGPAADGALGAVGGALGGPGKP